MTNAKEKESEIFAAYLITAKLILFQLIIVNTLRIYIISTAWLQLGRMPTFRDHSNPPNAILVNLGFDNFLLFFGRFLNPILIIIMLILLYCDISFNNSKKTSRTMKILVIVFVFIDIGIRFLDCYGYIRD